MEALDDAMGNMGREMRGTRQHIRRRMQRAGNGRIGPGWERIYFGIEDVYIPRAHGWTEACGRHDIYEWYKPNEDMHCACVDSL